MDYHSDDMYAYIAGLVDGDGTITIQNRGKNGIAGYRIMLSVNNCNDMIMQFLKNHLGGMIQSNKINITHPKWRNCNEYSCKDGRAANLISKIEPFLIIKKEQAKIALEAAKIANQYSSSTKRWHPKILVESRSSLLELKTKINILNVRGLEKQFQSINVKDIPFNTNYLAGFCDADGSLCISKGKILTAKIIFTNTNKNIIDWILYYLPRGSLYVKKQIDGKRNTLYSLLYNHQKAYEVALILYPLLLIKKRQAKLLLTFGKARSLKYKQGHNYRARRKKLEEKLRLICCNLNKRSI